MDKNDSLNNDKYINFNFPIRNNNKNNNEYNIKMNNATNDIY